MADGKLMNRFLAQCPFAVLAQVVTRGLIADEFDRLFEQHRHRQYEKTLPFSAMATAVADVVLRFSDNLSQAYTKHKDALGVSQQSFYEKVKATELPISEAVTARAARHAAELQDELGFAPRQILKGYDVYALDGNHLQESEKRLKPLRSLHDAPLAGTVVARFDLQRQLFDRAYLLEDAHAQESSTLDRVLGDLNPGDLILADRHYCVLQFLHAADEKGVCFLIRQHGRFKGHLIGERRASGRTDTGTAYEQTLKTRDSADALAMRRITVELEEPTRNGDTAIHLLTNLPDDVDARQVAEVYRHRWEEETGFYYLTTTLTCEMKSIGKPQAALFLFCMALTAFNVRQVVFAALFAEHDQEAVDAVSHHAVSVEIQRYTDGMLVVLEEPFWRDLAGCTSADLATRLREISRRIDLKRYRKSRRGPKKKVVKPKRTRPKTHVSTAKLLRQATNQTP